MRLTAIAILSVCLSVCPSVCPSHGWINQKRRKLGSPNRHRWLLGRLYSFRIRKAFPQIQKEPTRAKALNETGI